MGVMDMLPSLRRQRLAPPLPINIDEKSPVPLRDAQSATKLVNYIRDQYMNALRMRRRHARNWIMVRAIMRGVHWFHVDEAGILHPLSPKRGEVRAVDEIMVPNYGWMMGRLNANTLGVSIMPLVGKGSDSFWRANRAQLVMENWLYETDAETTLKDEMNQQICLWGMTGLYRYIDPFSRNVMVKPVPGPEWFPIPYYATTPDTAIGFTRAEIVTREWLAQQDEMWEREHPDQPRIKWERLAGSKSTAMSIDSPTLGNYSPMGSVMDGAIALTTWMKPSRANPEGCQYYLIEDRLVSELYGEDALPGGRVPIEFIYYSKSPISFWGTGFCETQISAQLEANRQLSTLITNIRHSRPINLFDPNVIDPASVMQTTLPLWVPTKQGSGYEKMRDKILPIPARPIGNDVPALLEMTRQSARRSGWMESPILFGEQTGRTESGPATNILAQNASTPLGPVIDRIQNALARTYPSVLDMLRKVWPADGRVVRAMSAEDRVRETMIARDDVPWSSDVVIQPRPMIAGGRNAMMQILFGLRKMPGDNDAPSAITTREMKRSLRMLGVAPPGIDIVDEEEMRIQDRIELLINDGEMPAVESAMSGQFPQLQAENHAKAIEMLKPVVLSTLFYKYGPEVKKALIEEMQYHQDQLAGNQPSRFDDAVEEADALRAEHIMDAAEQDLAESLY